MNSPLLRSITQTTMLIGLAALFGCVSSDAGTKAATATSEACSNVNISNLCPPQFIPELALEASSDCSGSFDGAGSGDEVSIDVNLETNTACVSVGMCTINCKPGTDESCRLTTNRDGELVCGECTAGDIICPADGDGERIRTCGANLLWLDLDENCPSGESCVQGVGCVPDNCGNGTVDDGEECDGAPSISDCVHFSSNCEKCDEQCKLVSITTDEAVENNVPRYGDGILHAEFEQCDDGNQNAGDGCGLVGNIERGYECLTPGGACNRICGNGTIDNGEECDEVTNISECSHMADCRKCDECVWEPITTDEAVENNVPRYGDGILHPVYEQCDDGNQIGGDGCDLTGEIEESYECPTPGGACNLICGNGDINSGEECDDGNQIGGDGCSLCRVNTGWLCTQGPGGSSSCYQLNNGIKDETEACDDDNEIEGDGCHDGVVEAGYACTDELNQLSRCETVCGDGTRTDDEACDEGVNNSDVGFCTSGCQVAVCGDFFTRTDLEPGDDGYEYCDDGGENDGFEGGYGDGCSPDCERWEVEPNDTSFNLYSVDGTRQANTINVAFINGQFDLDNNNSAQRDITDSYILDLACSSRDDLGSCSPMDEATWSFRLEFNDPQPCLNTGVLRCLDHGIDVAVLCNGVCTTQEPPVSVRANAARNNPASTFTWTYTGTRSGFWSFAITHRGDTGRPTYKLWVERLD